MTRKVLVLTGSLRAASLTRKLAHAFAAAAGDRLAFTYADVGALALYNEDVEAAGAPAAWTTLREQVKAADAVLVVTPEYNRGLPAALKNAIDVGSRPWGQNVFAGKPTFVISASMGALGGFAANQAARLNLSVLGAPVMPTPEAYIAHLHTWFDEQGALKDEAAGVLLGKLADAFAHWIERFAAA
jgi:chromate reductase